jgi:hypothetical protein
MKKKTDISYEPSGIAPFLIKGTALSIFLPAIFTFAGFLIFVPWLNLAAAVLVTPLFCALFYRLFSGGLNTEQPTTRLLTALVSFIGMWIFLCALAGTLSGLYGFEPESVHELRFLYEPAEVLEAWTEWEHFSNDILKNFVIYLISPIVLFEDLAAWNEEGWLILATAGCIAQMTIPQFLVKRRRIADNGADM